MDKLDFKKSEKAFYTGKPGRFDLLDVPKMQYLMIDGAGGPTDPSYAPSVAALYGLSYGIKFHCKKTLQRDHVVPPLSGFWWADDMGTFVRREKDQWKWTMALRQPDYVNMEMLAQVRAEVIEKTKRKKGAGTDEHTLSLARLEDKTEGLAIQVMHHGSYDDEAPVLAKMHNQVIPEMGLKMTGLHHEIYISDPRRVAPEKLKTILRQPVLRL
jgi:hypothetical protein